MSTEYIPRHEKPKHTFKTPSKQGYDMKTIAIVVTVMMLVFIAVMSSVIIIYSAKTTMSYESYEVITAQRYEDKTEVTFFNKSYVIDTQFKDKIAATVNKYPVIIPNGAKVILTGYSYLENYFVNLLR